MSQESPPARAASPDRRAAVRRALVRKARQIWRESTSSAERTSLLAPISPSPAELIDSTLPRLALGPRSTLVDLGCGDGRWLIAAAKRARCSCFGYDLNADLLARGRAAAAEAEVAGLVHLEERDFVRDPPTDVLRRATHVVVYWNADPCKQMSPFLSHYLPPAAIVVSVHFRLDLAPIDTFTVAAMHVRFYRTTAKSREGEEPVAAATW